VNIVYKPATGNAQEEVELPLKILMMGDYTLRQEDAMLEDRKPINVDKDNFSQVLAEQKLGLDLGVADKLSNEPGAQLAVNLKFKKLSDFTPEGIADQVPQDMLTREPVVGGALVAGEGGDHRAHRLYSMPRVSAGAVRVAELPLCAVLITVASSAFTPSSWGARATRARTASRALTSSSGAVRCATSAAASAMILAEVFARRAASSSSGATAPTSGSSSGGSTTTAPVAASRRAPGIRARRARSSSRWTRPVLRRSCAASSFARASTTRACAPTMADSARTSP